jgi:hypothetical protein
MRGGEAYDANTLLQRLCHRMTCKLTQESTSLQVALIQSSAVQQDFLSDADFYLYTVQKGSHLATYGY